MFIVYNVICVKVRIRRYVRFADSVYRGNLPHHTYMSRVSCVVIRIFEIVGFFVMKIVRGSEV